MEQSTPAPYIKLPFKSSNHVELEVHQFLEEYAGAIRAGNLDRIMTFYSKDIVSFDMAPPLEYRGIKAYREEWEEFFMSTFSFPIEYGFEKQKILTSGEFAVCHSLAEMNGQTVKGEMVHSWIRTTLVVQKISGEWKITHEHNSVPIDPESGKGLMDLGPEEALH